LIDLCSLLKRPFLILGLGSPLRQDDRAGLIACDLLVERGIECFRCEYGLENCIDMLRDTHIETLVLIDAALFRGGTPGDVVIAREESIEDSGLAISTHYIPLKVLLDYMKSVGIYKSLIVIGIYPKNLDIGEEVSSEVLKAVESVVDMIKLCVGGAEEREI
jgi:hydrogenase 3 maturation protease